MKARTFAWDDETMDVEILSGPNANGLVIVSPDGSGGAKIVRHKDRLEPLDDEARKVLRG